MDNNVDISVAVAAVVFMLFKYGNVFEKGGGPLLIILVVGGGVWLYNMLRGK